MAATASLVRATERLAAARSARDDAIRQAYASGMKAVEIAKATGLAGGRVYQILS